MDSYYQPQLSPQELHQRLSQQSQQEQSQQGHQGHHQHQHIPQRQMSLPGPRQQMNHPMDSSTGGGDTSTMGGVGGERGGGGEGGGGGGPGNFITSNHSELNRRRSIPPTFNHHQMATQDDAEQRMSMLEYNNSYSFNDPAMGPSGFSNMSNVANGMQDNMGNNMTMPGGAMDSFSTQEVLQGIPPGDFSQFNADMIGMVPNNFAKMDMDSLSHNSTGLNMFTSSPLATQFPPNPVNASDVPMDMGQEDTPSSASPNTVSNPMDVAMKTADASPQQFNSVENPRSAAPAQQQTQNMTMPSQTQQQPQQQQQQQQQQPTSSGLSREVSTTSISPVRGSSLSTPPTTISGNAPSSTATPTLGPHTPGGPDLKEKSVYSRSGFDMLRALWHVATRKNPEIHLGAVDMSCAFVVCDVSLNDCPIVYVSDNFQNLTGYSQHETVGKNCRFLQAPNGKVEVGSKREFVDDAAVYNLKKKIHERKEVQQSLINYRKGGKPFLNLLTMIPIPWDDPDEIRFFVGFQIDLVECPDAIASGQDLGGVQVNYKHSDIGQYIWTPPASSQWEPENGQTLGVDDVSTLLHQFNPKGVVSDWHKQSWDKMLLENTDDVVHVLSLKGLFLYLSPSCKKILEYDAAELVGNSLSTVCHPSDIVPVTRELKDTTPGNSINIVFRIRRKHSGYTWFESHGSLFVEQGKGRKSIILVGRKRPVFALSRKSLEAHGGIGDSELWTKISTSGMFLFVSSNVRSLLDLQPNDLVGTSIQELMRRESRAEFGRSIEKARRGKIVTCKHEVQNRRGQVLQAQTVMYPGDASEGQKPTYLLAQTKLLKASSRAIAPAATPPLNVKSASQSNSQHAAMGMESPNQSLQTAAAGGALAPGSQDAALAADDNIFDELRTTKCSSWQFELRQMEKVNRILAEELGGLLSNKKKRKRRKGVGNVVRDCANCHTRNTPEWRRGPSGQRDLCNSCGLRWAKQTGRVSPRNSSRGGGTNNNDSSSKRSNSPVHSSPLHREVTSNEGQPQGGEATTGNTTPGGTPPGTNPAKVHATMPPPSQPLLEGGSGAAVTSIREERESAGV